MPPKRFKQLKNPKGLTPSLAVYNPSGTAFMADAGMHAIIVTFPEMEKMNMKQGQLYNLSLKSRSGNKLESLYFSKEPKAGELMLFKWQNGGLTRLTTVMSGDQRMLSHLEIEAGEEFVVEDVHHIRERINATPAEVIQCIKDDVRMLERNMNIRCEINGCQRVGKRDVVFTADKDSSAKDVSKKAAEKAEKAEKAEEAKAQE